MCAFRKFFRIVVVKCQCTRTSDWVTPCASVDRAAQRRIDTIDLARETKLLRCPGLDLLSAQSRKALLHVSGSIDPVNVLSRSNSCEVLILSSKGCAVCLCRKIESFGRNIGVQEVLNTKRSTEARFRQLSTGRNAHKSACHEDAGNRLHPSLHIFFCRSQTQMPAVTTLMTPKLGSLALCSMFLTQPQTFVTKISISDDFSSARPFDNTVW